jgi:hypothetical protein
VLTQFGLASAFGSVGLLAHNYLAGENVVLLAQDQEFFLVYGDGRTAGYVVTGVRRFQALEPDSTSGRFVDLESGDVLSAAEMFLEAYARPGQVVLQTCIEKEDQLNWGRLFVIAAPID